MWQRRAVLENPGLNFLPPVEFAFIFLSHLTNEMLYRAVVLKGEPDPALSYHARLTFVAVYEPAHPVDWHQRSSLLQSPSAAVGTAFTVTYFVSGVVT